MAGQLSKMLFWLWPPLEARHADRRIVEPSDQEFQDYFSGVVLSLQSQPTPAPLFDEAKRVQDSELARHKALEDKGQSFVVSAGLAVSVISLVPSLFSEKQELPLTWSVIVGLVYFLAILHFVIAALYGLKARGRARLMQPSADTFVSSASLTAVEQIAYVVAQAKWNEPALMKKSNYVLVSERMFFRGLGLLVGGVFVVIATTIATKFAGSACPIPFAGAPWL